MTTSEPAHAIADEKSAHAPSSLLTAASANSPFHDGETIFPPHQFSTELFHFDPNEKRLFEALANCRFVPNYVVEEVEYLRIPSLENVAIPMTCFCDTPIEDYKRIHQHTERYGDFGIGLTKRWAISKGIQPVHYVVPQSQFVSDYREAFELSRSENRDDDLAFDTVANFLLTQLLFLKPFQDNNHCLQDECEWRYVPSECGSLPVVIRNPDTQTRDNFRGAVKFETSMHLTFTYSDVSGLVCVNEEGKLKWRECIEQLSCDEHTKAQLAGLVKIAGEEDVRQL